MSRTTLELKANFLKTLLKWMVASGKFSFSNFFFFFFYNKSFSNLFVYIIHCNFRSLVPPSANILLVYLLIHLNKYYSLRPNLFVLYSMLGFPKILSYF